MTPRACAAVRSLDLPGVMVARGPACVPFIHCPLSFTDDSTARGWARHRSWPFPIFAPDSPPPDPSLAPEIGWGMGCPKPARARDRSSGTRQAEAVLAGRLAGQADATDNGRAVQQTTRASELELVSSVCGGGMGRGGHTHLGPEPGKSSGKHLVGLTVNDRSFGLLAPTCHLEGQYSYSAIWSGDDGQDSSRAHYLSGAYRSLTTGAIGHARGCRLQEFPAFSSRTFTSRSGRTE